ncbi:MAG: CapA family protein [Haloplanus sp.]
MVSETQIAVAGDALVARQLATLRRTRANPIYEHIEAADASVVNLEMLLHDFDGYPASNSVAHFSGTYMRAPPWAADELVDVGFDAFAAANNHTGDYSYGGMRSTMRELESRDIPYAGLGRNLASARSPTYFDTPGGRVALVAAGSTVTPGTEAGPEQPLISGRPGLSPIRHESRYVVSEDQLDQLREVSESLGLEETKRQRQSADLPTQYDDVEEASVFHLLEVSRGHGETLVFEEGSDPGVRQVPNREDIEDVLAQIREANRQADWVVTSLHGHEGENGAYNDRTVAPFIESFARECVDAGADVFMGHGPHTLRGVEIYDGAPIFYSLGNFICQHHAISAVPEEVYNRYDLAEDEKTPSTVHDYILSQREYWETVLPVCSFEDGDLSRIDLYPAELGFDEPKPRHGEPLLAEGETAKRILDRLADLSAEYDTDVSLVDGVGVIEV